MASVASEYDEEDHLHFTGHDAESISDDEAAGDYAARMEEVLAEGSESDEDLEYRHRGKGNNADISFDNYRDQLRDVLGPDEVEEDGADLQEVEQSLSVDDNDGSAISDEALFNMDSPSLLPSTPPRVGSPMSLLGPGTPSKVPRQFLHPNVSRLRSYTPQAARLQPGELAHSVTDFGLSPSASHLSALSRVSSTSNIRTASDSDTPQSAANGHAKQDDREVFRWAELRNIGQNIYSTSPNKASSVLGRPSAGRPTALAANGLVCIGTDEGTVWVYDFKQNLKCVCGQSTGKQAGAVTSLALSFDHTYVASGHATGYIQLYDLKVPATPARTVPPTTLSIVATGRKEGHIQGSRIISIGFVAGRHTALVSADEHGLSFFHKLGKVLFVEAPDILRILGKYELGEYASPSGGAPIRKKPRYSVLCMAPLPLGTQSHPTDAYNAIALLTPTKLVVVGLKPTPRTWFKCTRVQTGKSKDKFRGSLAWFPSVSSGDKDVGEGTVSKLVEVAGTRPVLLYTWGETLHILRLVERKFTQVIPRPGGGKPKETEIGEIHYEDTDSWAADGDILAAQWLNVNQIVVLTLHHFTVYDVRLRKPVEVAPFSGRSLAAVPTGRPSLSGVPYLAHSLRVYKGKIFVLGQEQLRVGTLLTWADRILSFVQDGDFLSAIEITRAYYLGTFKGNSNGLPEDATQRQTVVGTKMQELMTASTRYAFSEDRMTDEAHTSGGVDRTALFEGLVDTCCRACIAIRDFDFLFEELFQQYDDSGISRIFLLRLEPFVLNSEIHFVPPRLTKRLISLHAEDDRLDLVEKIIWHVDPACLDIDQAISLCQTHSLYDALIYVYTRALGDFVAPVVQLLGLIRKSRQYRREKLESGEPWSDPDDAVLEPLVVNAYKIYPYLANVLCGLTYPSESPMPEEEALRAKGDVYTFLFFGRSSVWPAGPDGQLVLTADEDGGQESTYPYARQLLQFDAESFLHSLDIAFEDAYLNDDAQGISRMIIITILLEIISSDDLPAADITFVHIFIARNAPKYPQFLHLSPTSLHSILVGLAEDPDPNTREDRQLAAEYLLSVYSPHESEHVMQLFESAGFFRILRSWHKQEKRWNALLSTYLDDNDQRSPELFQSVDDVLTLTQRGSHGAIPTEVVETIDESLPRLLEASIPDTAILLDRYTPALHERALAALGTESDERHFTYLRHLLGSRSAEEYHHWNSSQPREPSRQLSPNSRQLFIALQCRFEPEGVVTALKNLPSESVDWKSIIRVCEERKAYDAVIWTMDLQEEPMTTLAKAEELEKTLTLSVVDLLNDKEKGSEDVDKEIGRLQSLGRMCVSICLERSHGEAATETPLEDIWFQVLSSQISCVQSVSACCLDGKEQEEETATRTVSTLRALVQGTFSSLVSISSTRAVSFPRLFKRLVNATAATQTSSGTHYTEFRTILTGMLESYRTDGDMLVITKHLLDRDMFETMAEVNKERVRGWAPSRRTCYLCKQALLREGKNQNSSSVVVSRTGALYHTNCSIDSDAS